MKKFFQLLLSDSNRYSTKRFIGIFCLIMFIVYGIAALYQPFNLQFWIFYVSLCVVTIWIAFKFMSSDKLLKYDVISKLTKFGSVKEGVQQFTTMENQVDENIQPEPEPVLPEENQEQ